MTGWAAALRLAAPGGAASKDAGIRRPPVNAPLRSDAEPRLEDFPYRVSDNVRYADLDPNQHVNNAVYASYFETGRVTLMKDRSYGLMPAGLAWVMVRLGIPFRAAQPSPRTLQLGG